jgi:hypothetical protein
MDDDKGGWPSTKTVLTFTPLLCFCPLHIREFCLGALDVRPQTDARAGGRCRCSGRRCLRVCVSPAVPKEDEDGDEGSGWGADEDEGEMAVLAATTTHCRRLSRAHCNDLELGARRLSLAENPKKENLNEGCGRHWRVYERGGEEEERKSEAQTPVRYAFVRSGRTTRRPTRGGRK